MPYREKIAWLTLVTLLVTYVPYVAYVGTLPLRPLPDLARLGAFAALVIVQTVVIGGGHIALRLLWPADARLPRDERESAIERRALGVAYYALMVGMGVVGFVMPFHSGGWGIVNGALLAVMVAETLHYGVAVASYRRQA